MTIVVCQKMGDIPLWLLDHPAERALAMRMLEHEPSVVVAKRHDGAILVVAEGYQDGEEIEALMRWAAV